MSAVQWQAVLPKGTMTTTDCHWITDQPGDAPYSACTPQLRGIRRSALSLLLLPDLVMKPTIVIAPGAWHLPSAFAGMSRQLQAKGYPTHCPAMPTNNSQRPDVTMTDDANYLSELLTSLADNGAEVVLVLHSYAGLPGSQVHCFLSDT